MRYRRAALFLFVLLPGIAAVGTCAYYLFQDWSALISAFARFEKAVAAGADLRTLYIAGTLDHVYRINAFADGVGVMLGALLTGLGIHGLCLLRPAAEPRSTPVPLRERLPVLAAIPLVLAVTFGVLASLARRVGATNNLRRAVIRGDAAAVRHLLAEGADPRDRLWWGRSALDVAHQERHPEIEELLQSPPH